jgi:polyisoprenoid-binding protein YceI
MSEAPTADPAGDHNRIVNHVLVPTSGVYAIDPVHTFVGFSAQHLVVGRVRGRFERVAGIVMIADEPTGSALDVSVETASITTLLAARDDDLRSERFLNVHTYPTMTYRSIAVIERPHGEWNVLGDLTIRASHIPSR